MLKNLSLIINCNQVFIRHNEKDVNNNIQVMNELFDAISNVYIPLLDMFENLEKDNILCRVGFVLSPVLCNLLSNNEVQDLYVNYLDTRIAFGNDELLRCKGQQALEKNIQSTIERYQNLKIEFLEKYNQNLISVFKNYMHKGYIELLATCATDIFIPHYADMKEVISAQIECGLNSFKQHFGEIPEGFWLPELGYIDGLEKIIKAYGFSYTIVDSRSLLLAKKIPSTGIFYPVRADNSLVFFGQEPNCHDEIYGEGGFVNSPFYRNENKDVGFELEPENLKSIWTNEASRVETGFKYWNRNYRDADKSIYDQDTAKKQAQDDAVYFIQKKEEKLNKAAELMKDYDFVCLVSTIDAYELSQEWFEGVYWLECLIRRAKKSDINLTSPSDMLENQYSLEKINPYFSSSNGEGYGENLLSSKNCWMMRYIRKACERMVDLADRFPTDTGLKTRLLNIGSVELMIAQSSSLAKMIDCNDNPEYAERRFKDSIEAFTQVFDSLGSNTVSTEWLTSLEAKDSLFPWMNYRVFSKKK